MKFLAIKSILTLLAILVVFFAADALKADTLHLHSGRAVVGMIIAHHKNSFTIKTSAGKRTFKARLVREILYGALPAERQALKKTVLRKKLLRKRAERKGLSPKEFRELRKLLKTEQDIRKALRERRRLISEMQIQLEDLQERMDLIEESQGALLRKVRSLDPREPLSPLTSSLILPGWGFFKKNRAYAGVFHAGLFAGSLLYVGSQFQQTAQARNTYNAGVNRALLLAPLSGEADLTYFYLSNQSRQAYQSQLNRSNQSLYLVGFAYVAQLVHLYFTERKAGPPGRKAGLQSSGWSFAVAPSGVSGGGNRARAQNATYHLQFSGRF